jgi:AcrR family transcriptional regulator
VSTGNASGRRAGTRDRILEAGYALAGQSGVAAVTLDAVANRAGVSKGGLLYHFPSKEALVSGMVDGLCRTFADLARLRVLVLAARAPHWRHGTLVFAHPQPPVARLLEITGADRLLDVRELSAWPDGSYPAEVTIGAPVGGAGRWLTASWPARSLPSAG